MHMEICSFLNLADQLAFSSVSRYYASILRKSAYRSKVRLLNVLFNITCNQASIQDLVSWNHRASYESAFNFVPSHVRDSSIKWLFLTAFNTAVNMSQFSTRKIPINPDEGFHGDQISCYVPHAFHFALPNNDVANTSNLNCKLRKSVKRSIVFMESVIQEIDAVLYSKYQHLEGHGECIRPTIQMSYDFEEPDGKSRFSLHFNLILMKKLMNLNVKTDYCLLAAVDDSDIRLETPVCLNCSTPAHVPSAFYHGYSGIEYHVLRNVAKNVYIISSRCGQATVNNIIAERKPIFQITRRPMSNSHFRIAFDDKSPSMEECLSTYLCNPQSNEHHCCSLREGEVTNKVLDEIEWFLNKHI